MQFLIVEDLGSDNVILGRDFIRMYDVGVDLPAHRIHIRNPKLLYTITDQYEADKARGRYVGKLSAATIIAPEEIKTCQFDVSSRRREMDELRGHIRWLAYVDEPDGRTCGLQERGIRAAKALAMVKGFQVDLALVNANKLNNPGQRRETPSISLLKEEGRLTLTPVRVTYKKIPSGISDLYAKAIELKQKINYDVPPDDMSLNTGDETLTEISALPIKLPNQDFPTKPNLDHIRPEMTEEQWIRINQVLASFSDVFAQDPSDLGHTHLLTHEIELEEGARPFKEHVRRFSPEKKRITEEQLQKLLDQGIVHASKSPFASAVVLVKKGDGNHRFCIDFRKLNDITVKDSFPLPVIGDSLESLGSAKYFTSLDMGNAFWQIPLEEKSRPRTAFVTAGGLWEWTRMPFGLCNATATFQRLMARALSTLVSKYGNLVLCYVDDILIATRTLDEHIDRVSEVFSCLRNAGLKLKAKKCYLFKKEIKFLGRLISDYQMKPDPGNIQKVIDWDPPRNKKELDSFLGIAGYYREFIAGFADMAQPLMCMKSKNVEFHWNEKIQEAFDRLKKALTSKPVLQLPDEVGEFFLDTDASAVAIAGILHQRQKIQGQDKLVVIAYGSRGLRSKGEKGYSAAKLEMLAAITFIEHFAKFLAGKKFTLRIDNKALSWLKTYSHDVALAGRWITRLGVFHFEIEHRLRHHHKNVDGLSKQTKYYIRRNDVPVPNHMEGFQFLTQEQFDALPLLEEDPPMDPGYKVFAEAWTQTPPPEERLFRVEEETRAGKLVSVLRQRYSSEKLVREQNEDSVLKAFRHFILNDKPDVPWKQTISVTQLRWFSRNKRELSINEENTLVLNKYYRDESKLGVCIMVPQKYQLEIIRFAHDQAGHMGITRTYDILTRLFHWINMFEDTEDFISACKTCQSGKHGMHRHQQIFHWSQH
jgi:hypothetical protein